MKSIQKDGNDVSSTELTTECCFEINNDEFKITYNESEATGFEGSQTTLTFRGNDYASIVRKGSYDSSLLLETGKKHFCHYGTPFGSFTVGINALDIKNELTEKGGNAYIRYTVDLNSSYISENEIFFNLG